jgi:predicted amidophosphoribosyltransferase
VTGRGIPGPLPPAGEPPGFPLCPECPYARAGPAWICVQCAGRTLEAIAPRACPVCSQRLDGDSPCRNGLCRDPHRRIERIGAISYLTGPLQQKIHSYKYEGMSSWAVIFARLLVGWLGANATGDPPGLIVANPTYTPDGRTGHIEAIIAAAAVEDYEGRWPFDTGSQPAIVKTRATGRSAGQSAAAKWAAAAALRAALAIPDPERTRGRHVLVFDDVTTTGYQLNAVADCLLTEGHAGRVTGLVLARAPWR